MESFTINLKADIYPLETIYSAAYVFLDRAYIIFDGDPKKEIKVIIYPKEGYKADELKLEFYNELINYKSYLMKLDKNKDVIKMIVEKALFSANPALVEEAEEKEIENLLKELEDEDDEVKEIVKEIKNDSKKQK